MSRADKNEAITKADMAVFQEERQNLETDLLDEVPEIPSSCLVGSDWPGCSGRRGVGRDRLHHGCRYSQPVPAHMLVMNSDGTIQQVSLLTPQSSYGDVADTYWVSTFIRHYESYEANGAGRRYDAIGLMAGPDVAEDYQKRYKWGTKEAMDKTVGDRKSVKVKVSSVILDRETGIATVRFSTTERSTVPVVPMRLRNSGSLPCPIATATWS